MLTAINSSRHISERNMPMEIKKNKPKIATLLTLLLIVSALIAGIQTVNAAADIPMYCFLTVNPHPVGVGQTVSVNFWLDKVTPTAGPNRGDRWQGITVTITKPDGTTETKGPFTLDPVASGYTSFVPTMVGTYYFQMSFPGVHLSGVGGFPFPVPFDNNYLPSTGQRVELTVQQDPVAHWQEYPLPSGYWTRPLNAEFRGAASIASYWLGGGSAGPHGPRAYDVEGNYQPYGTAPDTGHILWTREIAFGGIVGGEFGDNVYYPGESYERKFQPAVIMNGRLYYNQRLGASSWAGLVCVDMKNGEQLWYKEGVTITFGQLLDIETPNQHGVIPYLWGVAGSTYTMYDAFSGDFILTVTGVPSGSMIFGPSGEILIYTLSGAANTLSLWNSTLAINPTIDSTWSWRPAAGATVNGTAGVQWTVSVPDVAGTQSVAKISSDLIYARATLATGATTTVCDVAYDLQTKQQLWVQNRTFDGSVMTGSLHNGVFTTFVKELMVWYGFNARTGAQMWGPTEPYSNGWGVYQPYADYDCGYGKLFAGGYDGTIHCYDITTGENLWNYNTGSSGFETPYGTYPFKDSAITVADGKVYAATNEHSPNTPYFHGWRLHCIDVETGQPVWNISFIGLAPFIADGYAVGLNYFDNRIYCFGVGPSATTVTAAPKVITQGSSILIEGTVTDQSPGAVGQPAIADADMSAWMEHLYEQRPLSMNLQGVQVTLTALDPNGNTQDIGTVTTGMGGMFKKLWTPPVPGEYTIIAMFKGSASYGASDAITAIGVTDAPAPAIPATTAPTATPAPTLAPTATPPPTASPSVVPEPEALPSTDMYIIGAAVVVVIVIAAAAAVILRKRK